MTLFRDLSFKAKTIIGIAFIESILLALIYFTSINSLNETNENQIVSRASETSKLVAVSVRNNLITYDVGNTEHFIDGLTEGDAIIYVHIKNREGQTFAFSGDTSYKQKSILPDQSLKTAESDGVFDIQQPVMIEGQVIGHVELGLSVKKLSEFIENVAYEIKLIAVIEIILSALFSFVLGWFLTRRLAHLKEVAIEVKDSGEVVLVNDDAKDEIGLVANALDEMSTALLQTQHQLKLNSVKLSTVFEQTPDGVVVLDDKGNISAINPAFMKMIHCTHSIEGEAFENFVNIFESKALTDDYPTIKWLTHIREMNLSNRYCPPDSDIRLAKPNPRLIHVSCKRVEDSSVGIKAIFYFRDKTHTEEVERLKSEFLAHAAHELKTPLTSVLGFSELLKTREIDNDSRTELAEVINNQSQRVIDMVNELLDISMIEAGGIKELDFEVLSIAESVKSVQREFKVPNGRDPILLEGVDKEMPLILADKNRLHQIILNLVSNAYKYSRSGDDVTVRLETFWNENNVKGIDLIIEDNGIGMDEVQLEHIFDRFWRADKSGNIPGTGLGMSLVKELVDMHKGKILITSKPNEGTVVTVTFYALKEAK